MSWRHRRDAVRRARPHACEWEECGRAAVGYRMWGMGTLRWWLCRPHQRQFDAGTRNGRYRREGGHE